MSNVYLSPLPMRTTLKFLLPQQNFLNIFLKLKISLFQNVSPLKFTAEKRETAPLSVLSATMVS